MILQTKRLQTDAFLKSLKHSTFAISKHLIMQKVITRVWHGTTLSNHADSYLNFLLTKGIKDYEATPGNLGIQIWRSIEGNEAHFWTVTTWNSLESLKNLPVKTLIKHFIMKKTKTFLLEFEPKVKHFETYVVR